MRGASDSPEKTLRAALRRVPGDDLLRTLGELTRAMPVPLTLETVGMRLRATDGERLFYLVAMDGISPRETARRALEPFPLPLVRSLFVLGPAHSLARGLGMRWVSGHWLLSGDEPIGTVTAGTRTDRRPTVEEERLLARIVQQLAASLKNVDRSTESLEHLSARLAHEALWDEAAPPSPVLEPLRPRERSILALYTEGMSAEEIGRMLFISPHTVRTHVKNAFRRLGIHSREEAAVLVQTDEVARVV
jgi:DNA-binding CsgD family transcriptional regulator